MNRNLFDWRQLEPFRSDAAAVFNAPYWLSDGCTSGSCSVTWLLSRRHPWTRTHGPTQILQGAWQTPGSPSLITAFSRGAQPFSQRFGKGLAFVVRSHFCNSSPVSREPRLALVMPSPPSFFYRSLTHTHSLSLFLLPLHPFSPSSSLSPPSLFVVGLKEAVTKAKLVGVHTWTLLRLCLMAAPGWDHINTSSAFVRARPFFHKCLLSTSTPAAKLKPMIHARISPYVPLTCVYISLYI